MLPGVQGIIIGHLPLFELIISGDTTDYSLNAALATAGWNSTTALEWRLTVNSGIYVRASTTSVYAIDDNGITWPLGSRGKVTNHGFIQGKGGVGGTGEGSVIGTAGAIGGHAMRIRMASNALTVDNTDGFILGAGGGGGGGKKVTV